MFKFSLMVSLTPSYLLLITFQSMHVIGQDCPSNWFGPGCRYPCQCSEQTTCGPRGECNGTCESTLFGPGCQYVDIFAWDAIPPTEPYLLDGLYTTCNPDAHATKVEIFLIISKTFSWYRLIVKDTSKIGTKVTFETIFDGNQRCVNERVFIKDMTTVDVTCEMYFLIQNITIEGNIAPLVCSMHISEGRNVALKEKTNQTSTYSDNYSGRAVQDDRNSRWTERTCSQTIGGINDEWLLTLSIPARLYFMNVTTVDGFGYRLRGNIMRLITEDLVTSFTYTFKEVLDYHIIRMNSTIMIKYVSMKQTTNESLSLCEVEVYGDTICPDNKFGFMCDGKCSCLDTEHCNMFTGTCGPICQIGWYGINCTSRCSNKCLYRACDYHSGNCLPCVPGYKGDSCDEECSPGTYGADCKLNCSIGCSDTCKITNGTCACKNNFMGSLCEDCLPDTFGSNCQYNCSFGCDGECNNTNGHCICKEGYTGLLCTECRDGVYDSNCHVNCSKGCQHTCNNENGECICRNGYTGLLCLECLPGVYGPDCEFRCSRGCAETCNSSTGHCMCRHGYHGLLCADCIPSNFGSDCELTCPRGCAKNCNKTDLRCFACLQGWYGVYCDKDCSEFCFGKLCNMSNGDCFVCFGNRVGRLCHECNHSYYGIRCESKCSEHCQNESCDHMSGKCSICRKGFTGQLCLQGVEKPSPWVAPITLMPFLLLLFICLPGGHGDDDNVEDRDKTSLSDTSYRIIDNRMEIFRVKTLKVHKVTV